MPLVVMNYRQVLFKAMWHESGKEEGALEEAREELVRGKSDTGSPDLPGKLRVNARFVREVPTRLSHVSPKQSSNPTPPGCCSAFLFALRDNPRQFRVTSYKQDECPEGHGPAARLDVLVTQRQQPATVCWAEASPFPLKVQYLARHTRGTTRARSEYNSPNLA